MAQLKASTGLRSTRETARQREVSEVGTSNVSEPESLRKTHLTSRPHPERSCLHAALATVYSDIARRAIGNHEFMHLAPNR